jgi:hypothetical protein
MPRKNVVLDEVDEATDEALGEQWLKEQAALQLGRLANGGLSEEEVLWLAGYLVWGLSEHEAVALLREHQDAHAAFLKLRADTLPHEVSVDLKLRVLAARVAGTP